MEAQLEHPAEPLDELRPAARVTQGQRVGAQQQHGPHDGRRQRLADAGGVAQQQPLLQLPGALGRHEGRGQRAETGGHAVDDLAGSDEPVDDGAGLQDALASIWVEPDAAPAQGHRLDVGDGQLRAGQDDGRVGVRRVGPPGVRAAVHASSMGMCTPRSRATSMARS